MNGREKGDPICDSSDRWFLQAVIVDGTAHIVPAGELENEPVKERLSVEAQPSAEL
jgi:hypothetical protein